MQEETDLDVLLGVANFLAQHLGQHEVMVVVHPDDVAVLGVGGDRLGELAVDFVVGDPGLLVKGYVGGVVVEEGPEDGVCRKRWLAMKVLLVIFGLTREAIVMLIHVLFRQEDRRG